MWALSHKVADEKSRRIPHDRRHVGLGPGPFVSGSTECVVVSTAASGLGHVPHTCRAGDTSTLRKPLCISHLSEPFQFKTLDPSFITSTTSLQAVFPAKTREVRVRFRCGTNVSMICKYLFRVKVLWYHGTRSTYRYHTYRYVTPTQGAGYA